MSATSFLNRALYNIPTKCKCNICLVYQDDVIVLSNNLDEHIRHINEILTTLHERGVILKINMFSFFHNQVEDFGHIIKQVHLYVDKKNVESLTQANKSTTKTQWSFFLGSCSFYQSFDAYSRMHVTHSSNSSTRIYWDIHARLLEKTAFKYFI